MFRGCLLQNGFAALALILGLMTAGCVSTPGKMLHRRGDEIMVAGQLFHTGTRVVLWSDPGGFDAYRVERRFAPWEQADWTIRAPIRRRRERPIATASASPV